MSVDDVILVLQWVRVGRSGGDKPRAAACERMAVLQLETLRRRAGAGNKAATETLTELEREIDRAVAAREIPPLYRALYQELSRRAAQGIAAAAAARLSTTASPPSPISAIAVLGPKPTPPANCALFSSACRAMSRGRAVFTTWSRRYAARRQSSGRAAVSEP